MLKLIQEEHHYELENGESVMLRFLQPSEPYGAWAGTGKALRKWYICYGNGSAQYKDCTVEEALAFEKELQEFPLFKVGRDVALGTVLIPFSNIEEAGG